MVELIYDQLKTPKTVEELLQRLQESGLKWNKEQVELFLHLDNSIKKNGDKYFKESNYLNIAVLQIIDKEMEDRPIISIKKIMEFMPHGLSDKEVLEIAVGSSRYESPNGMVIKKI